MEKLTKMCTYRGTMFAKYANSPSRFFWSGSGYYYGTEIDSKWYKRYRKASMFARGAGKFKISAYTLIFEKHYGGNFHIPILDIKTITLNKWHAGKWSPKNAILKINWENNGEKLSSGFHFSSADSQLDDLITFLKVFSFQQVTEEDVNRYSAHIRKIEAD